MKKLRFAIIGTGFWANYQIPAWLELDGIEIVALFNRTKSKANTLAKQYDIPAVYDNIELLFQSEKLDFIDIITDVDTHQQFVSIAAQNGVAVICQKPMAPKLNTATAMVNLCKRNNVSFFIHENWRWQAPIRALKSMVTENRIGKIFKARVTFCSAFPVFDNQPFLKTLDEFILTDIGSHILDVCRFLFGEVTSLYCTTSTVNPSIKGEDVANVLMKMENGISCHAEMSYASILEHESFPQTFILIEGEHGSIYLTDDCEIRISTRTSTQSVFATPKHYAWADPSYALVHSSIVDCNRNIFHALQGAKEGETNGTDNLKTVTLVHAAYESARTNKTINIHEFAE